jgi:hypothetical protein
MGTRFRQRWVERFRGAIDAPRLCALLELEPAAVAELLERRPPAPPRLEPIRVEALKRPRSRAEQKRVDRVRRRRAKAAAIAAELAPWKRGAAARDDEGCEPLPPPAVEPVADQVAELAPALEALPSASSEWHGPTNPHDGTAERYGAAKESLPAPAVRKPRAQRHRWRPGPNEPRLYARGSAARYDDQVEAPCPTPADGP